jgi:DNA-binding XRE family transcriptional regulator
MSAKRSNGKNLQRIGEILEAFFQLDARTQREVHEQLKRLRDPQTSEVDRDTAEKALETMLGRAGAKYEAGRVLTREQRLGPAHRELRERIEQAEAAFAATLARLMAERQMTQAQLAERIGVGQSAIAMLLKRRCRPQRRTLGKLAEALAVPVEELWPGFSTGWRSGVM